MGEIKIRNQSKKDRKHLLDLIRRMPEWFNESSLGEIRDDLIDHEALVALDGSKRLGFINFGPAWEKPADGRREIHWFAVDPQTQGQGIGKRLFQQMEADLRFELGTGTELIVWTVGDSVDYEPYEQTRAFYRHMGMEDWVTDHEGVDGSERLWLRKIL